MKISAPYGTWRSTLTAAMMTSRTVGLSGLFAEDECLYWLESRPAEAGRSTLIRWTAAAGAVELTPAPVDVGTRVHEYGGGAWLVAAGHVVYGDRRDGSVWHSAPGAQARQIAAVPLCRYADFALDLPRSRLLAVREDHRDRPPNDPAAAIVALDLTGDPAANAGEILVAGPDFLAAPRLDGAGGRLAWLEWDHPDMPWDGTRLQLAPLDAAGRPGPAILVAGGPTEAVLQPEWSRDGSLLFSSDRSGWWNLWRWQDGRSVALAPVAAEIGGPAWQLASRHFAELPDGRIVAALVEQGSRIAVLIDRGRVIRLPLGPVAQSPVPFASGIAALVNPPDAPPSILRLAGPADPPGAASLLRSAGPTLLDAGDVAVAEPFEFPTGDGVAGHALHYRPRNRAYEAPEGTAPPLIVLCHGGPTAMTGAGFSLGIQWWTSRGFAVCDVNYRGSTGYGRPYRELLRGRWGVADVEDCIAAAACLVQQGLVDPARIAIRGGSAGGFTVLAALTLSDVFKAGASHYGIADLALLAGDTHKFESRYLDGLIGPLPAAARIWRERSPINRLDRLAAPVIFFQGLDDRVVPPNQAAAMVDALTRRGLPVAYYPFEGEAHGFRRAETIERVLTLELGFFGRIFGFDPPDLAEPVSIRNLPPAAGT